MLRCFALTLARNFRFNLTKCSLNANAVCGVERMVVLRFQQDRGVNERVCDRGCAVSSRTACVKHPLQIRFRFTSESGPHSSTAFSWKNRVFRLPTMRKLMATSASTRSGPRTWTSHSHYDSSMQNQKSYRLGGDLAPNSRAKNCPERR
jgi:hypothetical protein